MIIFGVKDRVRSTGSGTFSCPRCAGDRQYDLVKYQQWFTLYFVPIFPVNTYGKQVQCRACSNAFDVDVLSWDPFKAKADRDEITANLWRSCMIAVACASGPPGEAQITAVYDGMVRNWRMDTDHAEIVADCQWAPAGGIAAEDLVGRVSMLAPNLNAVQRASFLAAMCDVICAGPASRTDQQILLQRLGHALGLSEAHVRGLLST